MKKLVNRPCFWLYYVALVALLVGGAFAWAGHTYMFTPLASVATFYALIATGFAVFGER